MSDALPLENGVSVISIGDELLIGQTVNTNAAWLGDQLASLGWRVVRCVTIPDDRSTIVQTIREEALRAPVVITSGGLGPTHDDVTRESICDLLSCDLETDENQLGLIERRFSERGIVLNERSRRQALVPSACRRLSNVHGSAPGLVYTIGESTVYTLPGVPSELKGLFADHMAPELGSLGRMIERSTFLLYGVAESVLADTLVGTSGWLDENVQLAFLPAPGGIRLRAMRLSAEDEPGRRYAALLDAIRSNAREWLVSERDESLAEALGRTCAEKRLSLATAESCTAGLVAGAITDIAGSSAWFRGGVVSYSNDLKRDLLGVPQHTLDQFGAVSEEVACAMAGAVRNLCGADIGIGVTGIAGPGGGTELKPVGTVWIAVATGRDVSATCNRFGQGRDIVRQRSVAEALNTARLAALRL